MKYLLIDDMPSYLKSHKRTLESAGHTAELARDVGTGWISIKNGVDMGDPFDLVLIDLALDREIPEFNREYKEMKDVLHSQGYGDLPISGQALGLRLWRMREEIRQRYCYITNHPQLWLDNLNREDPEFGGEKLEELQQEVVLDKSDLWSRNIQEKLHIAHQVWMDKQWI
uniref:Response regulator receiver domain-containing protein n=1 Tax=Candidatus Kentrum sp. DK TaxID=2126562 RepID=A0A450SSK2_9GAMM|nr:MAG: hypothetical protein BECKDK2373B_GA0170837_106212 [Candidatus Kentron sp. DK]VFJ59047.1 MAG: hypothetical protein BECKDK2373C_GA0170839_106912 [Candidatus Kentron sp. DK]